MDRLFPLYCRAVGLPLSRVKGVLVDQVPFSLVESMVWMGLLCALILLLASFLGRWQSLKRRRVLFPLLVSGPVLLIFMGMGQGAFPLSLAPTACARRIGSMSRD